MGVPMRILYGIAMVGFVYAHFIKQSLNRRRKNEQNKNRAKPRRQGTGINPTDHLNQRTATPSSNASGGGLGSTAG